MSPRTVGGWREFPAMPTDAFKHGVVDETDRRYVFVSSGTTSGPERRSRHALASLDTYRRSAIRQFAAMVVPDEPGPMAALLLGPSATSHPHSSLGRMFTWCVEEFAGNDASTAFAADGTADVESACAWLEEKAAASAPVLVLGVTSALTALFDGLRRRDAGLRLPADSRIVDTGGSKGGGHVLSARGILKAGWRFLHVPAYMSINEYGMTEMLSQFYDDAWHSRWSGRLTPRAKVAPPWVRTVVVDPATLMPVADGATGILAHFDLANWDSVSALQTLDLGRTVGRGFELLGRAPGAEARGCSQLLAEIVETDDEVHSR